MCLGLDKASGHASSDSAAVGGAGKVSWRMVWLGGLRGCRAHFGSESPNRVWLMVWLSAFETVTTSAPGSRIDTRVPLIGQRL